MGGNAGGEQRSDRSRDDSRRQHVHELGAGVVLSLYRLLKTAQLHALDNRAVTQQLEQTTDSLHTLCERIDAPVSVLFTRSTVFVNGQLLKGSRTEYEAALELGEQLGKYQLSEVSIEPGVTSADLEAWVAAYRDAATLTEARHRLRRPSPADSNATGESSATLRGRAGAHRAGTDCAQLRAVDRGDATGV